MQGIDGRFQRLVCPWSAISHVLATWMTLDYGHYRVSASSEVVNYLCHGLFSFPSPGLYSIGRLVDFLTGLIVTEHWFGYVYPDS